MYSADQSALAESVSAIKAAWHCDAHGACYIDGKREHIELNRFRLKAWASAVVSLVYYFNFIREHTDL